MTTAEMLPTFPLAGPSATVGPLVKFSQGPYNGLIGKIVKAGETHCAVEIEFDHRFFEVVTPVAWLAPVAPPAECVSGL